MNVGRVLRGAARVLFGIASLGAFGVSGWTALHDQTAPATVSAGLCIALAILAALDLESFEGLGIKAQLRNTLSDAEARLDGLDRLIRSLARGAFVQAARGAMSDVERQATVAELTVALQTAGMNAETIEAFKRPVYEYIAGRLWYVASIVRTNYLVERVRLLEARELTLPLGPERDAVHAERDRLASVRIVDTPHNSNFERFRAMAQRMAVETPVTVPEHTQMLVAAMGEISDLFEGCRAAGNLTDQAMAAMGQPSDLGNPFAEAMAARFR